MRADDHVILFVGLDLPPIFWMSLADIDDLKLGMLFVFLEPPLERLDMASERRSRVASEDQDSWAFPNV
jgi:hypothetical protein